MKLTAILILVGLQAAALSGSAQRVTISKRNAALPEVFSEIYRQTGYAFTYSNVALEKAKRVSLQVKDAPIEEVLGICFKDQQLQFTIIERDKVIVIKQKKIPLVFNDEFNKYQLPVLIDVTGRIVDSTGQTLAGVSVQVKATGYGTSTDGNGYFELKGISENAVLVISAVNIETREIRVAGRSELAIVVRIRITESEAVVVNTGYQTLPRERATGSFSTVSTKQLDRRPVADILSKLEGYVSGVAFHRASFDEEPKLVIRGRSTIYANDQPLIVVDGFPIEGNISSINPNDVQSITVLKDAAAASIWGVRAGNGVIVIVTKKGRFNQKPSVEIRSQLMMGARPNLHYLPLMSTADFVDLEQSWFNAGRYDGFQTTPAHRRPVISEAISIMMDEQNGVISNSEAQSKLNTLKGIDVRNEAGDVLYRKSSHQQYMLNVSGGAEWVRYFFSAGFDKDLSTIRQNSYDRITIRSDNSFRITPQLDLNISMNTSWGTKKRNGLGLEGFQGESSMGLNIYNVDQFAFYPYQKLFDGQGKPVSIAREINHDYNAYLQNLGFLDWGFRPGEELQYRNNTTKQNTMRLATGLEYRILKNLKLDLKYQYEKGLDNTRDYRPIQLYSTRHIINRFSGILPDSSGLIHHVPVGDIMELKDEELTSHVFRGQVDFNEQWNDQKHAIALIGGMEVREVKSEQSVNKYFGYDDRTLDFVDVDYTAFYPTFPLNFRDRIESYDYLGFNSDRYVSFYANGSYTLLDRYIFSASGRIDKSNMFGVKRKDRNVPLWSAGLAWNIAHEPFFNSPVLSSLKLRTTYGFNGNIDKNQSAFPAAFSHRDYYTGLLVASVYSPANPLLQWEKVNQLNIGVDLGLWNNAISASIEYYSKKGIDLLGDYFLDPSSGFSSIRTNIASMKGSGIDIELNATAGKQLQWQTKLLFSHARDRITDIATANANDPFGGGTMRFMTADRNIKPMKGRPVYSIYSYAYAGLDAQGNPQLYDGDHKIGNYTEILVGLSPEKLVYHGPVQPTFYGGWSNTFSWKGFSLTGTVTYKFGHKFRRNSVNYMTLGGGGFRALGHADYANRWQKPGDENTTIVPRPPDIFSYDQYRDPAYLYSDALIEDAAHIRLKDITLSYDLVSGSKRKYPFKGLQVYLYADNIGILWRANKFGIDPDYVPLAYSTLLPIPFTLTAGFKVEF